MLTHIVQSSNFRRILIGIIFHQLDNSFLQIFIFTTLLLVGYGWVYLRIFIFYIISSVLSNLFYSILLRFTFDKDQQFLMQFKASLFFLASLFVYSFILNYSKNCFLVTLYISLHF